MDVPGLKYRLYRYDSDRICYIVSPMDLDDNWMKTASEACACSIAVITGMDWDNALTPWPAPGQPPGCAPFRGRAGEFGKLLLNSVMPDVESRLGLPVDAHRTLTGISLSGLFALWFWLRNDAFIDVASISGSFWYDGFVHWLRDRDLPPKRGRVYISLGDRETHTPVKAFRSVGADTAEVCRILSAHGVDVTFEQTAGNHFAPIYPRIRKALEFLYLR